MLVLVILAVAMAEMVPKERITYTDFYQRKIREINPKRNTQNLPKPQSQQKPQLSLSCPQSPNQAHQQHLQLPSPTPTQVRILK